MNGESQSAKPAICGTDLQRKEKVYPRMTQPSHATARQTRIDAKKRQLDISPFALIRVIRGATLAVKIFTE